jgi:hypothetical protein
MPVTPEQPDTPGSDPGLTGYRDTVRTLIRDGQPSYATGPYGLVRQEELSDELDAQATPTQIVFYVRWSTVPLGKNVTITAVPSTIAVYVDGNTVPLTVGNGGVVQDIDFNGNFEISTPPTSRIMVTYGWQIFQDEDLDQILDQARSWVQGFATIDAVPDGLAPALTFHAAAVACETISRQMSLPDVTAGEAKESLSGVAKQYAASAKDFFARADKARQDFYTSGDQPLQPQAAVVGLAYPAYQPFR